MANSKEISKKEGVIIKKKLNQVLENFDSYSRHALAERLHKISRYVRPYNGE